MKKVYTSPELAVIELDSSKTITTTSGETPTGSATLNGFLESEFTIEGRLFPKSK